MKGSAPSVVSSFRLLESLCFVIFIPEIILDFTFFDCALVSRQSNLVLLEVPAAKSFTDNCFFLDIPSQLEELTLLFSNVERCATYLLLVGISVRLGGG